MKKAMIIWGVMASLAAIAAFFNTDHVWTSAICGCLSYGCFLEHKYEKEEE